MKAPDSRTPEVPETQDTGRMPLEDRVRRLARLALAASLPLMAVILIFMLVRGETIPTEMWFVAIVWAGWVLYTLRGLGRDTQP